MQGQKNSNLDALGRRQAEVHGRLLAAFGVDTIFASPLDRARQTVDIVRRFVELEAEFDERIMEWDSGDWSGHLRAEVRRRWPEEWAALEADPYHYRGPRAENYPDMIARAEPFVARLRASPGRRIAVISHGMIGRIMVGILMGFGEPEMLAFRQPNQVIYRVRLGVSGASGPLLDRFVGGLGPFAGVVSR
jgi:broad specificity phosphatase PhoE